MNDLSRQQTAQLTLESARAAGARFLSRGLSPAWRMAAETWVDSHHPVPLPDENDEQFTERMGAVSEAYVAGIREHLLHELGGAKFQASAFDVTELATTLEEAAQQLDAAASVMTLMADTLAALLEETKTGVPLKSARLAAQACIRVGRQAALELNAKCRELALEADRYEK